MATMAILATGGTTLARSASLCVLLDPFKDACAIDHGAVRAGYPQNLVMVAVEVAGMEQSLFPTVESSGGQFAAADPIYVDYVPLFFHGYASSLISRLPRRSQTAEEIAT
jgi:hypothetical protein